MTDQPMSDPIHELPLDEDDDPTVSMPPPNFQERLQSAVQARQHEVKPSVSIPLPRQTHTMTPVELPQTSQLNRESTDNTPPPAEPK